MQLLPTTSPDASEGGMASPPPLPLVPPAPPPPPDPCCRLPVSSRKLHADATTRNDPKAKPASFIRSSFGERSNLRSSLVGRAAHQNRHVISNFPPPGPTPARSDGFGPRAASDLAGLAVKNRMAPTPTPATATPVSTSLTSASDLIELTVSSGQLGLHLSLASSNLDFAARPVATAAMAAAPPTPNAM